MAPLPFAAGRIPGSRPADAPARLQHVRNVGHSEHRTNADQLRAIEALDREMLQMPGESISARLNRRARGLEVQTGENDMTATPQTPPVGSPMAVQRRRRILRPERLARIRSRIEPVGSTADSMEETAASLRRPPPPIEPSDIAIQEYMGEAQFHRETRWRAKRRKLDDGTYEGEATTFSYGHNGQVVAGQLKLEIVSCDGGAYSEPVFGSSWPQNVLQDDTSVYSTKSDRCNLLLRHVGGMPFSLTKLVIKAPRDGYDAPIQEGMIFIAMEEDKLLERTAPYEIRYSPKKTRVNTRRGNSHIRFGQFREYMNSVRSPLRSVDRSSYLRDPYSSRDPREAEIGILDTLDDILDVDLVPDFDVETSYDNHSDNEGSLQRSPRARRWSASHYNDADRHYIPPVAVSDYYRPTYHDTDNEEDSQDSGSSEGRTSNLDPSGGDPANRRFQHPYSVRHRRLVRTRQLQQEYDAQASVNTREIQDDFTRAYRQLDSVQSEHAGQRLRMRPSRIEIRNGSRRQDTPDVQILAETPDRDRSLDATFDQEASHGREIEQPKVKIAMSHDVLKPHARFFIRRDKSSVSIHFDPPV